MNIKAKIPKKVWTILGILSIAVLIGLAGVNIITNAPYQNQTSNIFANSTSLVSCSGLEVPFDEKNASHWGGVAKCENGTLIKILFFKIGDKGKITYSGVHWK